MAILKHFNVKNSDYSAALRYFVFEHDERSKPLKDEQGNFILRESYLIDGINCCPMSYDVECRTSNRQWGKNLHPEDIKQHHFILSFEPSDMERGLTLEKAQTLGMEFARKHFAGHQCLVATHADGHNGSKNIHCHIALNSLRIEDLPEQPAYSQYERDRKAGYKFHPTREMMQYLKAEIMRLCRANGLGQVELNQPAKKKVTDKEYWAQKRGEKQTSSELTKFQTALDQLRQAIDMAKHKATSVEDFKRILLTEYGISIRDKRGRWSYQTPTRKNGVTARRLGSNYSMEAVTAFITEQLERKKAENTSQVSIESCNDTPLLLFVAHRLYNLNETRFKDSIGLEQWAKLQNLKEMSRRFNFLCENGALSAENLVSATKNYAEKLSDRQQQQTAIQQRLDEINRLLRWEGQLNSTKAVYTQYCTLPNKRQQNHFYCKHQSDIDLYCQAYEKLMEYKKAHGYADKPLPSMQKLKREKADLLRHASALDTEIQTSQENVKLLQDAQGDVMTACADLNLTSRSEYESIFGKKLSIRKQVKHKTEQVHAGLTDQKSRKKLHYYHALE